MFPLLLLLILLFRFMFNRRHMQGSFNIKTVKKLLICHCHRHLWGATCSTFQGRQELESVKSQHDKQRDCDTDCAMCFPCQNGMNLSQRIPFLYRVVVTRCHSALEAWGSEWSLLWNKCSSCPWQVSAGQQSDVFLSSVEHRDLALRPSLPIFASDAFQDGEAQISPIF